MSVRKEDYEDQIQVHIDECEKLRKENAELKEGVKSMFDMADIMKKLSAPLPVGAIQRTDKNQTRKSYDTTGYGYQYIVNRFNEVLGADWGYYFSIIRGVEGKTREDKTIHDITVSMKIWIIDPDNSGYTRECVGGHLSLIYVDALKGAITNAFKKTAAFWGVGKDAYEGVLDDDANYPAETSEIKAQLVPARKVSDLPGKPVSITAPPAVSTSKDIKTDMSWTKFWGIVKNDLGYTSKEVHDILGVYKMEVWLQKGKTLAEAITLLKEKKGYETDADEVLSNMLIDSEENY